MIEGVHISDWQAHDESARKRKINDIEGCGRQVVKCLQQSAALTAVSGRSERGHVAETFVIARTIGMLPAC